MQEYFCKLIISETGSGRVLIISSSEFDFDCRRKSELNPNPSQNQPGQNIQVVPNMLQLGQPRLY